MGKGLTIYTIKLMISRTGGDHIILKTKPKPTLLVIGPFVSSLSHPASETYLHSLLQIYQHMTKYVHIYELHHTLPISQWTPVQPG